MLRIGVFSRICQVPVKALRYYDAIGLLKPDRVDGSTGYRYCTQSAKKTAIGQRLAIGLK